MMAIVITIKNTKFNGCMYSLVKAGEGERGERG
jgi:hypothetical protein